MTDIEIKPDKQDKNNAAPECAMISEKQFMRDHTLYSAVSSWLFAIAGATSIGVLCAFSSKLLMAVEQGKPVWRSSDPKVIPVMGNKKYNRIALGMMAFGGACMGISNWLESKKVVTEWQLGAGKLQRKMHVVEEKQVQVTHSSQTPANDTDTPPTKNWVSTVQSKTTEQLEAVTDHLRRA